MSTASSPSASLESLNRSVEELARARGEWDRLREGLRLSCTPPRREAGGSRRLDAERARLVNAARNYEEARAMLERAATGRETEKERERLEKEEKEEEEENPTEAARMLYEARAEVRRLRAELNDARTMERRSREAGRDGGGHPAAAATATAAAAAAFTIDGRMRVRRRSRSGSRRRSGTGERTERKPTERKRKKKKKKKGQQGDHHGEESGGVRTTRHRLARRFAGGSGKKEVEQLRSALLVLADERDELRAAVSKHAEAAERRAEERKADHGRILALEGEIERLNAHQVRVQGALERRGWDGSDLGELVDRLTERTDELVRVRQREREYREATERRMAQLDLALRATTEQLQQAREAVEEKEKDLLFAIEKLKGGGGGGGGNGGQGSEHRSFEGFD